MCVNNMSDSTHIDSSCKNLFIGQPVMYAVACRSKSLKVLVNQTFYIWGLADKGYFFTLLASFLCAFVVLTGLAVSYEVMAKLIVWLDAASPKAPLGSQPVLM